MNWKEFIESLGSDKYLAEQLGVSRGHVCIMRNGRKGREKKIPSFKYWNDFISLAHAADMKHVDWNYLGRLER